MTYWRMQVHPGDPDNAVKHTVESITAGYIGLDFIVPVPDLLTISQEMLPKKQQDYWAFAHEMKVGDRVLVFAHNYPLALIRIAGGYNYVRSIVPEIGVWFRHFRKINDVRYYGDYIRSIKKWVYIPMSETTGPLRDPTSKSYQLIEKWLHTP